MIETIVEQHAHLGGNVVNGGDEGLKRQFRKMKGRDTHSGEAGRVAYVNHGRWVILCECGAGNAVTPGRPSVCFECGAWHEDIQFPADVAGIEAALGPRPSDKRNWFPHETVADLLRENVEHGAVG